MRAVPNWLVSCCENAELRLLWIVAAGVDGSKTVTFGPRSGVPGGGVASTGLTKNDWAAVPLHVYCWSCTLSAVDALGTSRHLPLLRLTKW